MIIISIAITVLFVYIYICMHVCMYTCILVFCPYAVHGRDPVVGNITHEYMRSRYFSMRIPAIKLGDGK